MANRNLKKKLEPSEILIEEGDLRETYRSKFGFLPEALDHASFRVNYGCPAKIMEADLKIREGLLEAFCEFGVDPKPYFIVNLGHAHLLGIADFLVEILVDCNFVLPDLTCDRFHETAKYWAGKFKDKKEKMVEPKGFASLVDAHRKKRIDRSLFPEKKDLERLGVERVIYLMEGRVGPHPNYLSPAGASPLSDVPLSEYSKDFPIEVWGIDLRQGFVDPEREESYFRRHENRKKARPVKDTLFERYHPLKTFPLKTLIAHEYESIKDPFLKVSERNDLNISLLESQLTGLRELYRSRIPECS